MLVLATMFQEAPEGYRPSDWLSAVIPKKFPYYPQMGDEIMFFKEGYQLYLDAVSHRKIYQLTPTQLNPWGKTNIKVILKFALMIKEIICIK